MSKQNLTTSCLRELRAFTSPIENASEEEATELLTKLLSELKEYSRFINYTGSFNEYATLSQYIRDVVNILVPSTQNKSEKYLDLVISVFEMLLSKTGLQRAPMVEWGNETFINFVMKCLEQEKPNDFMPLCSLLTTELGSRKAPTAQTLANKTFEFIDRHLDNSNAYNLFCYVEKHYDRLEQSKLLALLQKFLRADSVYVSDSVLQTLHASVRRSSTPVTIGCSTLAREILHKSPTVDRFVVCEVAMYDTIQAFCDTVNEEGLLQECTKAISNDRMLYSLVCYIFDHGEDEIEKHISREKLAEFCFVQVTRRLHDQYSEAIFSYLAQYVHKYGVSKIWTLGIEEIIFQWLSQFKVTERGLENKIFSLLSDMARKQIERGLTMYDFAQVGVKLFSSFNMCIASYMRSQISAALPTSTIYSAMLLLQSAMENADDETKDEIKKKVTVKYLLGVFYQVNDPAIMLTGLKQLSALMSTSFARDLCMKDFNLQMLKEISKRFENQEIKEQVSRLTNRVRQTLFDFAVKNHVDVQIGTK